MKKILVFQHVPSEGLGTIGSFLKNYPVEIDYVRMHENGRLSQKLEEYQAVISMGGPMNVDEMKMYPFLTEEYKVIQKAIQKNIPLLGICLGSQLIACALGSRVYHGPNKEIGWYPISISKEATGDPVFNSLSGQNPVVFHWHGCTFDLPNGGVRLASSALYQNQAFRFGNHVYGFQFHIEITSKMIRQWLEVNHHELELAGLLRLISEIKLDTEKYETALTHLSSMIYKNIFTQFRVID